MLYDRNTQETRCIENPNLDVEYAKSVVVKKALIVLKGSSSNPIAAYKYTSFYDPANTVKIRLPDLPYERSLFSACKLGNDTKVILSGGISKNGLSAQVHALNTTRWKWEQLVDLNIARFNHGSTSIGQAIYVACGMDVEFTNLSSVERLEMGSPAESQAWTLIDIPQLTPRELPVFSQLGPDQLCILGGSTSQGYLQDGVVLNVQTQEVTAINPASKIGRFYCQSESFMEKQGHLLSLVEKAKGGFHLIRYSLTANSVTFVHNFGNIHD